MKSKKHILILTPGFPNSEADTTCIPALQILIKELHKRHHDKLLIDVVSVHYPFTKGNYTWNEISCWSAGGKNRGFPFKILTWLQLLIYVFRLHFKNPVDVIHAFWLHDCSMLGSIFSWLTGARLIVHCMGQDVRKPNKYIPFIRFKKNIVISNSSFTAATLLENFKIKTDFIIPFGINPDDFLDTSNPQKKIDLLAVGSLTDLKNHKLFIEIFELLKIDFPTLTGSIIGGGPLHNQLQELIFKKGLQESLILEGEKKRDVVLQRMAVSKILIHTSAFESAGYVFLEALQSKMAVISFKTGFLPEVKGAYQCSGKDEMIKCARKLLAENTLYEIPVLPLIADAADKILEIYSQEYRMLSS